MVRRWKHIDRKFQTDEERFRTWLAWQTLLKKKIAKEK